MNDLRRTGITALCAIAGSLAAVASGAGVFLRGDLATRTFTTARGSDVELLTNGIYRLNGQNFAAEGVGWDAVTLFLVVPALAIALVGLWRGSLRATLATIGILAYFAYQYVEYSVALAYGPLFLVYVATFSLSLTGIALLATGIDLGDLAARSAARFPHRAMVGFGIFMAVLLAGMWLPLIARSFDVDRVTELYGGTTLVVQAFDLGVLVPLGLFTAATVYRRQPVGYLLSAVVVVKGIAMATGIVAMLIVEAIATGEIGYVPIGIFAFTAALCALLAVRVYTSIETTAPAPARDTPSRTSMTGSRSLHGPSDVRS